MTESEKYIVPLKQDKLSLNKLDQLSEQDKNSFLGSYSTVMLKAGMPLWRFSNKKKSNRFSDFWIDSLTMANIMRTFNSVGIFDSTYKKKVVRDNLAILAYWGGMLEYRVKIELKKEVIAHIGTIRSQKMFIPFKLESSFVRDSAVEKMVEHRIGGLTQYVIPRLKDRSLNQEDNEYAKVVHFSHI